MEHELEESARSVEHALKAMQRRVVDRLQPGIAKSEFDAIWGDLPFAPTEELRRLYGWHDGTLAPSGTPLVSIQLFPGFHFPPLREARDHYLSRCTGPQWAPGWWPVFADGAGDFYNVLCHGSPKPSSEVIGFLHGEPLQLVEFLSLTHMMKTLAQAYEAGAIILDGDMLEFDDELFRLIALKHNPGVEAWER